MGAAPLVQITCPLRTIHMEKYSLHDCEKIKEMRRRFASFAIEFVDECEEYWHFAVLEGIVDVGVSIDGTASFVDSQLADLFDFFGAVESHGTLCPCTFLMGMRMSLFEFHCMEWFTR